MRSFSKNRARLVVFVVTVLLPAVLCSQEPKTVCAPGWHLRKPDQGDTFVCLRCKEGTYMPLSGHVQEACFPCSKVEDNTTQELVSECSRTQNAVIKCRNCVDSSKPLNTPIGKNTTVPVSCCNETTTPCTTQADRDKNTLAWPISAIVICCVLSVVVIVLVVIFLLRNKIRNNLICRQSSRRRNAETDERRQSGAPGNPQENSDLMSGRGNEDEHTDGGENQESSKV